MVQPRVGTPGGAGAKCFGAVSGGFGGIGGALILEEPGRDFLHSDPPFDFRDKGAELADALAEALTQEGYQLVGRQFGGLTGGSVCPFSLRRLPRFLFAAPSRPPPRRGITAASRRFFSSAMRLQIS